MRCVYVCPFDDGSFQLRVECEQETYSPTPMFGICELHAFAAGVDFWEWVRQECDDFGPPLGPLPSFEEIQATVPTELRPTASEISDSCKHYLEGGWKKYMPQPERNLKPPIPFYEDDAVLAIIRQKGIRLEAVCGNHGYIIFPSGGEAGEQEAVLQWLKTHHLNVLTYAAFVPGLHGADLTDCVLRQAEPAMASAT